MCKSCHFTVLKITSHSDIRSETLPARIERWVLRMLPYKLKVKDVPGPNTIVDPLSRTAENKRTCFSHNKPKNMLDLWQ